MSFINTISQKPWLDNSMQPVDERKIGGFDSKRIALNFFLGVVGVFFSLFIVTFLARSQYPDFVALASDVWQPFHDATRLWINTGFIVVSSIAIQLAYFESKKDESKLLSFLLIVSVVFALQFIFAQLMLWRHLQNLGFFVSTNPANSYFYVLTAVHAIHIMGGALVLMRVMYLYWRNDSKIVMNQSLILCARYWHFLLFIWAALFALLVSPPETYDTLAALCGF